MANARQVHADDKTTSTTETTSTPLIAVEIIPVVDRDHGVLPRPWTIHNVCTLCIIYDRDRPARPFAAIPATRARARNTAVLVHVTRELRLHGVFDARANA